MPRSSDDPSHAHPDAAATPDPAQAPDPFAPPRSDADAVLPDGTTRDSTALFSEAGRGPWRDGHELVVHTRSRPGDFTWRDGKDATSTIRTTLTWHPRWVWAVLILGVLPYFLVRALTLRRVRVTAPAHASTPLPRWLGVAVAVGLVFGGVLVLLAFPPIFIVATLLLRLAVLAIAWSWPLARVRQVESNRAWVRVHPAALEGVPELPRASG